VVSFLSGNALINAGQEASGVPIVARRGRGVLLIVRAYDDGFRAPAIQAAYDVGSVRARDLLLGQRVAAAAGLLKQLFDPDFAPFVGGGSVSHSPQDAPFVRWR